MLITLCVLARGVHGQVVVDLHDEIDFDRPEAWGLKYAATVAASTILGATDDLAPGAIEMALEIAPVPSLSAEDRRLGFVGTKIEDIDRPAAFGRLRWRIGLPRGWAVGLGIVPPLRLEGLEPRLAAVDLSRVSAASPRLRLVARAAIESGEIRGDITCSANDVAAGDDRVRNPFLCEARSRDVASIDSVGIGLTLVVKGRGGLDPYLGFAVRHLDASFQVDARYSGLHDRTRLDTDGWIGWVAAGASHRSNGGWRATAEVQYAPLQFRRPGDGGSRRSVVDIRFAVARRLR